MTTTTAPTTEGVMDVRVASTTAIAGALTMVAGAALYFSTDADLWAALDEGQMASYLAAAGEARGQLVANLTLWIVGVLLLGTAIRALAEVSRRRVALARLAIGAAAAAVPLAILSFIAMMALVVQIAPETSATPVAVAEVVGWIAARADDLATVLLVAAAPLFLALAARGDWMPTWLVVWAYLAAAFGLVSLVGLWVPALVDVGFLVVPAGLGWLIAAGLVVRRHQP